MTVILLFASLSKQEMSSGWRMYMRAVKDEDQTVKCTITIRARARFTLDSLTCNWFGKIQRVCIRALNNKWTCCFLIIMTNSVPANQRREGVLLNRCSIYTNWTVASWCVKKRFNAEMADISLYFLITLQRGSADDVRFQCEMLIFRDMPTGKPINRSKPDFAHKIIV